MGREERKRILGKNIIALDEINSSGYIKTPVLEGRYPCVIGGYLMKSYAGCSGRPCEKYEHKGGVFSGRMPLEELRKRAKFWLDRHRDFYYAPIPPSEIIGKHLNDRAFIRAFALSSVILAFYVNYPELTPTNSIAVFDQMDGNDFTESVLHYTREFVCKMGEFSIPFIVKRKNRGNGKEREFLPLRRADRALYYLFGLKCMGGLEHWPHKKRKVDCSRLEELAVRSADKTSCLIDENLKLQKELEVWNEQLSI